MFIDSYIWSVPKTENFNCERCSKKSTEKFKAVPSIPALVDWKLLYICKPCAMKEIGSKKKKLINKLMENKNVWS